MISDANKAVNDLASIVPLLGGSSSRKDYEAVSYTHLTLPTSDLV